MVFEICFLGRLVEFKLPNFELVTQGGLPITKISFVECFLAISLKSKSNTLQ